MITEDFVSFETAKLLEENGFDWECKTMKFYPEPDYDQESPDGVYAPTLQTAMKWLRKVHKLGVFPSTYTNIVGSNITYAYGTAIVNLNTHELMTSDSMERDTYEEACEAAIKYCLKNLI